MKEPRYQIGDTVYWGEDPEKGTVQEIVTRYRESDTEKEHPGYIYRVTFEDQPEDWPGYRYAEDCLYPEPTRPFASKY